MAENNAPAAGDTPADASGKKVFILYPHSVIRDEMLDVLIMAGFETYTLTDHARALKLLACFPGSIMFINIDDGMKEKEWEVYIKSLLENPKTKDTKLGILSYNQDKDLMKKYLMDINVPCGYVQLKLGIQESTKIILGVLQANEARGRRKYIRAFCEDDNRATVNVKVDMNVIHGQILDISAAGLATRIEGFPEMPPKSILRAMQLNLRGAHAMVDAILIGKRHDDSRVQIFLFEPSKMKDETKQAIRHFVKLTLQRYIENLKV